MGEAVARQQSWATSSPVEKDGCVNWQEEHRVEGGGDMRIHRGALFLISAQVETACLYLGKSTIRHIAVFSLGARMAK